MTAILRAAASVGAGLLTLSFFVPPGFHNAPAARFGWALEGIELAEGFGDVLTSIGLALVIAYAYAWAAVAALAAWFTRGPWSPVALWSQVGCQIAGGTALVVFGLLLLVTGDAYVPSSAQIAAVSMPPVLICAMLAAALGLRERRRVPAVALVGFLPHLLLQPVLAYYVWRDGWRPVGYLLGTAGAVVGITGWVCLFIVEGIGDGDVHRHSHVQ